MKLKEIMISCIKGAKEEQEEYSALKQEKQTTTSNIYSALGQKNLERRDYSELVQKVSDKDKIFIARIINNILRNEVTLEDLEKLKELKKETKELFLEDLKSLAHDEALHKLNLKIMEHAKDLTSSDDPAFLLRTSNNGIFRDLFYLEAKNKKWKMSIDNEKTLTFDLPEWLLELYQSWAINFYQKRIDDIEGQKAYHAKCYQWMITPFEQLSNEAKEVLKENYLGQEKINKSLAQSIMYLFISNFFKQDIVKNADASELISLAKLEKEFNSIEGIYIKKLEILNILSCLDYPTYNKVIPLESIEILGDTMTF